jgi:CRISPR-associated protein Cas1
MKRPYYIFSAGRIRRQQNTLFFERSAEQDEHTDRLKDEYDEVLVEPDFEAETDNKNRVQRRIIPIEDVESLYCFGEMTLNSKLINFLSQHHIIAHFFNYYGFYSSSLVPREYLVSGEVVLRQAEHYLDSKKRLSIAKEMISAAVDNILKNMQYYHNRGRSLEEGIEAVQKEKQTMIKAPNPQELMAAEGRMRGVYFKCWDKIIEADFQFEQRTRRPPENAVNALISFGNSMLYTTVLGEIYHTQLNPTLSFLHEPGARRFSLSLDVAEVFKPFLVDRLIFKLLNQASLKKKHFDEKLNFCYLNEEGRKIFVQNYDERLKTTIKHRGLGRNVSYRRLIRLEAYKLVKHITGIKPYKAFRLWW